MTNKAILLAAATFAMALVGSCSSSDSSGGETTLAPTSSAAAANDPPTTPSPTTVAPTTFDSEPPPPAFLRSNGLGQLDFGTPDTRVVDGMAILMPEMTVTDQTFTYLDPEMEYFFHASGRRTCWSDAASELCAYFGGDDSASASLVGWRYVSLLAGSLGWLFSDSGATLNMLVSDFPAMSALQGICAQPQYGWATLDGVTMFLASGSEEPFGTYTADGAFVLTTPMPPTSTIYLMTAGELIPEFIC